MSIFLMPSEFSPALSGIRESNRRAWAKTERENKKLRKFSLIRDDPAETGQKVSDRTFPYRQKR
jgi:hypothetical protein